MLSEYQLLSLDPTHICGSLLDYVSMRKAAVKRNSLEIIQTVSVYSSDHEAV